jgi:hypothetical protein
VCVCVYDLFSDQDIDSITVLHFASHRAVSVPRLCEPLFLHICGGAPETLQTKTKAAA